MLRLPGFHFRCVLKSPRPLSFAEPPPIQLVNADQSNAGERRQGRRTPRSSNSKDSPMGLFTKDVKTMNDLFLHQLQDVYYAEHQLVKALQKLAGKAADTQLKSA